MTSDKRDDPLSTGGAFDVLSGMTPEGKDPLIGRELGDYRVTRLIAEGGMGRVYRAERIDGSFERDVAIKVSYGSGLNRELHERFLREQQILADMDHSSVASLYDAGTTSEGWPYFIMELVDGRDIERFVDEESLSQRSIIRLFLPMLDALAFAHSRLIVHRDIKASNIIVDEKGKVRLLDFGIAKLLGESPDAATSARPLSLVSASPEQLLGEPISTASDIYQVGLLLHRLLVGRPAYPERTLGEAVRDATEVSSFRLSAESRQELGTDLAGIVSRCLQPEPKERYRDVNALRADLENYLEDRPVSVGPPTLTYRIGKLVRRNRLLTALLAVLAVVTVGGTITYTLGINEARRQAEQEAATAEEVIAYLTDVFRVSDPEESRGESVTARELLDRGAADIEAKFPDRPLIRARLQHVIGGVYREMGLLNEALVLAESAYATRLEYLGPESRDTLISGNDLAILYDRLDRPRDAIRIYDEVLSRQRVVLGSDDPHTMKTINNLGAAYISIGDFETAAVYLEEAFERRRRVLGPDNPETVSTHNNLPIVYANLGDYGRAIELFEESLDYSRRINGDDSPATIIALTNLGMANYNTGRFDSSMPYFTEAWELARRVVGDTHQVTLVNGLSRAMLLTDRPDIVPTDDEIAEAEALVNMIRETAAESFGPEHSITTDAIVQLANIRNRQGRHAEALEMLLPVLEIRRSRLDASHAEVIDVRARIAGTWTDLGRYRDAIAEYQAIDRLLTDEFGEDYPKRYQYLQQLADAYTAVGDRVSAERLLLESAEGLSAALGADDPRARLANQALNEFMSEGSAR